MTRLMPTESGQQSLLLIETNMTDVYFVLGQEPLPLRSVFVAETQPSVYQPWT